MSVIALLTDFGMQDPFVGVMKGIIADIAPRAQVIDLTHAIPPQNLTLAAFHLFTAHPYFPRKTIFCCVVDPGVGTQRRAIAVETQQYFFVAPDNGLLSWTLAHNPPLRIVELTNTQYQRAEQSRTFHGRDIFAPVAAHLARGIPLSEFGPPLAPEQLTHLPFPSPRFSPHTIETIVLAIDRFGNAITALHRDQLPKGAAKLRFRIRDLTIEGLAPTFAAVAPGQPLAYIGSFGYIELAIRNGNFARTYRIGEGEAVIVEICR